MLLFSARFVFLFSCLDFMLETCCCSFRFRREARKSGCDQRLWVCARVCVWMASVLSGVVSGDEVASWCSPQDPQLWMSLGVSSWLLHLPEAGWQPLVFWPLSWGSSRGVGGVYYASLALTSAVLASSWFPPLPPVHTFSSQCTHLSAHFIGFPGCEPPIYVTHDQLCANVTVSSYSPQW